MSPMSMFRSTLVCVFAVAALLPLVGCSGQASQDGKGAKDGANNPKKDNAAPAPADSKLSKENAEKIKDGMTVAEVEAKFSAERFAKDLDTAFRARVEWWGG